MQISIRPDSPVAATRHRRALVVAMFLAVVTAGLALSRNHLWVQNFHAVEPGAVYRGAEQKPGPLRRIIERHEIRTIVCLVDPEPDEQAMARSLGVQWLWVPLGDCSTTATFNGLEQLAAILAEPANRPVFFHCRRGIYRSNLGQAVYRMKCCSWTLEQSLAELRTMGFDPDESGGDNSCVELLTRYYQQRILEQSAGNISTGQHRS